jgi:hypothetical protein
LLVWWVLQQERLRQILSRTTLRSTEIDVFRVVESWLKEPQNSAASSSPDRRLDLLKACVWFRDIDVDDILTVVRRSGLITGDQLLDIMEESRTLRSYPR